MDSLGKILLQLTLLGLILAATSTRPVSAQAQPGCPNSCGNITIPYPFGTADGCYIAEDFLITCDTTFNPPKAFLTKSDIQVLDISLQGQLRISQWVAHDCYYLTYRTYNNPWLHLSTFPISSTQNKFTAVGCDTFAVIQGSLGNNYETGCLSLCGNMDRVSNGSCSGIGYCQTSIPKGVGGYIEISVSSYKNDSSVLSFNPCSYAFVVEEGYYNFSSLDLANLRNVTQFPAVLDWTIGNQTCREAKMNQTGYACKGNSSCYDPDNGPGYGCNYSVGYQGNPLLEQ